RYPAHRGSVSPYARFDSHMVEQLDASGSLTRVQMSGQIKACALGVGFDRVGIVAAECLSAERARLEEWLRRGFHGEMTWMARDPEQRASPLKIFPEAKSVVVVV